jgi:hypothetical protein
MTNRSKSLFSFLLPVTFVAAAIAISVLMYNLMIPDPVRPVRPSGPVVQQNTVTPYSFSGTYDYIRPVLLFLVMILGMFFNQLFEALQKQKKQGKTTTNIGATFREGFRGITFWMAVVVSPIIYFCTYFLVSSIPDDKVAYFYAFQNGFFWYYIFNKFDLRAKADSKKAAVIS